MNRREFLKTIAFSTLAWGLAYPTGRGNPYKGPLITKTISSTGKSIPVIGMGTWQTFDVGQDTNLRKHRSKILETFFKEGGGMIDSSPMYGSSESVVGYGLNRLNYPDGLFPATKIWTSSTEQGKAQFQQSLNRWGVETLDLEQVHNMVNWENHLETLFRLKAEGKIDHVGVTTYGGYSHGQLEKIMKNQPLDFIQLTYNVENRKAENRILPLAQEKGVAVIANRPFGGGPLIDRMQRHPFPSWGKELDCANWPQLLLKFIVSHPALTCAIPATTQIIHMQENMGACHGRLLEPKEQERIVRYVGKL